MSKTTNTAKYRIFELEKEFNQSSQTIIEFLKKRKIKVANRFSAIEEDAYKILQESLPKRNKPLAENKTEVKQEKNSKNNNRSRRGKFGGQKKDNILLVNYDDEPKKNVEEKKVEVADKKISEVEDKKISAEKVQPKIENKTEQKISVSKVEEKNSESEKNISEQKISAEQKNSEQKLSADKKNSAEKIPEQKNSVEQKNSEQTFENKNRRREKNFEGGKNNFKSENSKGGKLENKISSDQKNEKRKDRPKRGEENSVEIPSGREDSRGERGDRNSRKNRDSSREDGGKTQNRNRNRKNKNAATQAKNQQQAAQNQNQNLPSRLPKKKKNRPQQTPHKVEIARPTHIKIGESIAVKDLASKMSCTAAEIIKKLLLMGVIASINQEIDFDTAALVASEFGVTAEELPPEVDPTLIPEIEDDPKTLKLRPPVVTVMGHVDHGKTSLLDVIRQSSVTSTEAGGITQHIGAYQVICNDKKIVFLDTPGHEAFTAMRARGAQVTDVAVLVVAADDGVMPQTVEAINHAKAAGVPIIVAINKIDKPGANPAKVKQELMEYELVPEDYGGDTIMVEVSAKKKIGINNLLEMILLVAEVQELKANPNREARGVIIEAQLDKGRGSVATVLVQSGTLRIGDAIVAGTTYGHVRAMINDRGDNVKKAGPSVPVEVLGLNDVPAAGDILAALDEKLAKSIAEHRQAKQRNELIKSKKVSLDDLFNQIKAGEIKDLNIVVKADVQGSIEALSSSLLALNEKNDEVRVNIVHSGVGAVNESDIMLASAANALIIAFNVRPDANARKVADAENIDIRNYRVIYDAIDDVKAAMSGMLAPKFKEIIQGRVEIRKVMKFSKALVAGSYVLEGKIFNNSKIRLIRDHVEIFDGEIDSLRRFKDEVKEVAAGYECGISIVDYRDFKEGDIIEAYSMQEIETSIDD